MRNPLEGVNVLALVVIVTAGVLVGIGEVDADAFLLLVTGLAIPARNDGYQSTGTGARGSAENPLVVEGKVDGEPVVVDEAPAGTPKPRRRSPVKRT